MTTAALLIPLLPATRAPDTHKGCHYISRCRIQGMSKAAKWVEMVARAKVQLKLGYYKSCSLPLFLVLKYLLPSQMAYPTGHAPIRHITHDS